MVEQDRIRAGRLTGERSGEVATFLSSMDADRWIASADVLVDIAHLVMLVHQGLIEKEPARAVMRVLLELHAGGLPEVVFDEKFEDIHAGIEAYLIARTGEDNGGRLHTGRSRNDEVATCIRLRLREEIAGMLADLVALRETLLNRAAPHEGTVMPGFTHLQHAQPTTLAHYLIAYEEGLSRDFDRLRDALGRINHSPLGAAAFASTGLNIDREQTAHLLGFIHIAENTMDAVSSRDGPLEALAACSILMATVSRCSEELVLWSSPLVRFVELDETYCSTSSIMPQKKNPDVAEVMRAKAGTVAGSLTAALTIMKGLPMSYNRDLQELTPHLWRGVQAARESVRLLNGMIATARYDVERMRVEAGKGFATATDLADLLVKEYRIPFRQAHTIVGRAVRLGGLELGTIERAAMETAGISLVDRGLNEVRIREVLDPATAIMARGTIGGPSPVAVRTALKVRRRFHRRDEAWLEKLNAGFAEAEEGLLAAAKEVAG